MSSPCIPSPSTFTTARLTSSEDTPDSCRLLEPCDSSDDEGGVFFGQHHPAEAALVHKLSERHTASSTLATPSPQVVPRRSSRAVVTKRDSREFLRRKTMLLPRNPDPSNILREIKDAKGKGKSTIHNSFRERYDSDGDFSAPCSPYNHTTPLPNDLSPCKTPRDLQSDLTLDFSTFRLSDFASPSYNDAQGEEGQNGSENDHGSSDDGGSDKENATVSRVDVSEGMVETVVGMRDLSPFHKIEIESTDGESEEEVLHELDMGGLRLSDFSDPDTGLRDFGSLENVAKTVAESEIEVEASLLELLGCSDRSEDGDQSPCNEGDEEEQPGEARVDADDGDITVLVLTASRLDDDGGLLSKSTSSVAELEAGEQGRDEEAPRLDSSCESTESMPLSLLRGIPQGIETTQHTFQTPPPTTAPARDGDTSEYVDSPLPVVRAGPVIIPKLHYLAHLIPVESTSPVSHNHLPFDDELVMYDDFAMPSSSLTDSPPSASSRVSSTSPATILSAMGPREFQGRVIAPLKSSIARMTGSCDRRRPLISSPTSPKKQSKKEVMRALAIREQLNAASLAASGMRGGTSRAGLMGPPQRSVSAASGSSSGTASRSRIASATILVARKPPVSLDDAKVKKQYSLSASASSILPHRVPAKQTIPVSRPILTLRTLPQVVARPITASMNVKPVKPPISLGKPASMIDLRGTYHISTTPPPVKSNPLKRSFPVVAPPRQGISLGPPSRPIPIQPSKAMPVCDVADRPIFSIGVTSGESCLVKSPATRRLGVAVKNALHGGASRGTPGSMRTYKLGTPLKGSGIMGGAIRCSPAVPRTFKMGTPSRGLGTPIRPVVWEAPTIPTVPPATHSSKRDDAQDADTVDGPSPPVLRESTIRSTDISLDNNSTRPTPPISASQEKTDSQSDDAPTFAPPSQSTRSSPSNPSPKPSKIPKAVLTANRPKRATKPAAPAVKSDLTIVPGMSEKELKAMTQRNTSRNEVFFCAIDRQIIKRTGERPPSPQIRKWEEREEEEKKKGRGERAKKRSKSHEGEEESEEENLGIERLSFGNKAPGDQEEWVEPERPAKRLKFDRGVKWGTEMTVFKGELGSLGSRREDVQVARSCIRTRAQIELDRYGNIVVKDAAQEKLKRMKVTINAIYYDGEEPVAFQYNKMGGKGGKSRKK